jgi:hypothetical protein
MDRISKTSLLSTKKKMPKECENAYPPQNTAGFSDFPEKLRNRWLSMWVKGMTTIFAWIT